MSSRSILRKRITAQLVKLGVRNLASSAVKPLLIEAEARAKNAAFAYIDGLMRPKVFDAVNKSLEEKLNNSIGNSGGARQ